MLAPFSTSNFIPGESPVLSSREDDFAGLIFERMTAIEKRFARHQ